MTHQSVTTEPRLKEKDFGFGYIYMRCSALQVARHVPHTIQNPNPDTIHRPYVCCVKQSINAYMTRTARSRLPPARRRTKTWTIEKGASRREEKNRCTTLCRSDYVTPATAPSEGIFIRVHRKKKREAAGRTEMSPSDVRHRSASG